jgi:hypothetical protein
MLDRLEVLFKISFACGITLSLDKLEIGMCVKFPGFLVSDKGLKPDPAKMNDLNQKFPHFHVCHGFALIPWAGKPV